MIKKFTLTLLSLALAVAGTANATSMNSGDDALSFAVVSDLHHGNAVGEGPAVKVPRALKNITSYKALDAIFAVGDITDAGTAAQYNQFRTIWGNPTNFTNPVGKMVFMMGNHDNRGDAQASYQSGLNNYSEGTPYPLDQYMVIKGYPFITISQRNGQNNDYNNAANGESAYPAEVREQLKQWLAQAAEECPGKPIFVFTHVAPRYTCYSSWPVVEGTPWSMNVLNPILNKYPQVVVFAGHSHYPIGDPRSIHQGVDPQSERQNYYTVINTGSTTYSEIHDGAVSEGIHPAGYATVTEGMILTEQPNGDIEIRRYDTYRNEEIDPEHRWVLKAPFDGSMFEYADKRDADDNPLNATLRDGLPAPAFTSTAEPEVKTTNTQATIKFPQATDDNCVFRYKVSALKDGIAVKEKFVFSQFYLNSAMPETISATLEGLDSGTEYTFTVTAYDSYDNASEPISVNASTTETPVTPVGLWTFDNADDLLAGNSELTLQAVKVASSTVTVYDEPSEIGIVPADGPNIINKAITVPKGSYLKLNHTSSSVVNSYTLMYDIKPKVLSGYQSLLQTNLKNTNDGDFFINNKAIGYNKSGLGYGGTLVEGKWHRVVFVVNEGFATTYLDGVKIGASTNADGIWPLDPGYALLFADNNGEEGVIDLAELAYWNQPLSDNQVKTLGTVAADLMVSPGNVKIFGDDREFSVLIASSIEPHIELPEWIEEVSATPVTGGKNYIFRAAKMKSYSTRKALIKVSGQGGKAQTVMVTQTRYQDGIPSATGEWTFDDTNDCMYGTGVATLEPAKKVESKILSYEDPTEIGIEAVDGPTASNRAVRVPKDAYLKLNHMQSDVQSTFTIMYDLKPIALSGYQSLLQTDLTNGNDGDFFINGNKVGHGVAGLGYSGKLVAGKWHRIVYVLKDGFATVYIDGAQIGTSSSAYSYWQFNEGYALLFADNDGEEGVIDLAEFRYWNTALNAEQVKALGVINQGQFTPITADIEDSKMTLHGDITLENFYDFADNTDMTNVLSVDLTEANYLADIPLTEMQEQFSDNTLFVASANAGLNGNNLIVDGACNNLVITDCKPFAAPIDFTANLASYERMMPSGSNWGTICLPYSINSDETTTYYTEGTVADGALTLVATETVEAGTPAIFQTSATTLSAIGSGNVKAGLSNAVSDIILTGTYKPITVTDENAYYIKSNKFWRRSNVAGGYFSVAPFRAYFTAVGSSSPSFSIVVSDDLTGIGDFVKKSASITAYYDLQGNRIAVPRKGVNIIEFSTGEKQKLIIK